MIREWKIFDICTVTEEYRLPEGNVGKYVDVIYIEFLIYMSVFAICSKYPFHACISVQFDGMMDYNTFHLGEKYLEGTLHYISID